MYIPPKRGLLFKISIEAKDAVNQMPKLCKFPSQDVGWYCAVLRCYYLVPKHVFNTALCVTLDGAILGA